MLYCPYCGSGIKEDEFFCSQCGCKIPNDIHERIGKVTNRNKTWYIPIIVLFVVSASIVTYYIHLGNQTEIAKDLFKQGEEYALNEEYTKAISMFEDALEHKANFPAATTNKSFLQIASNVNSMLVEANNYLDNNEHQQALALIDNAEDMLKNYNGDFVNQLIERIVDQKKATELKQLQHQLELSPSIDELKNLLWQAESIQTNEADTIAQDLRNQIISYTSSTASEHLKEKQYSLARDVVSDGLKYAPNSEKLLSLKTTIEKEKIAFETEQQNRIEQALNAAEQEREINKNDAVELTDINITTDEQKNLVVSGKIKSVATVPINSISIQYILLDENESELLTNEVYVYPDTLYPDEEGKFDFTHYDFVEVKYENMKVKIETIKWFLD